MYDSKLMRRYQVWRNNEWEWIDDPLTLKTGDIFKAYEPDGTPVSDVIFQATTDATHVGDGKGDIKPIINVMFIDPSVLEKKDADL